MINTGMWLTSGDRTDQPAAYRQIHTKKMPKTMDALMPLKLLKEKQKKNTFNMCESPCQTPQLRRKSMREGRRRETEEARLCHVVIHSLKIQHKTVFIVCNNTLNALLCFEI